MVDKRRLKIVLVVVVIAVLIYVIFFSNLIKKNCGENKDCFDNALQRCKAARFITIKNNNIYSYTIKGSSFGKCVLVIKMEQAAIGTESEIKQLLEGKSMVCKIPKTETSKVKLEELEDLIGYCTGPLKEGMYELIIKRMYALVVKQMGGILTEAKDVLKGV